MAAPMEISNPQSKYAVPCVIFNIPGDLHSPDLRNFFGRITEANGFSIFHNKHRPMSLFASEQHSYHSHRNDHDVGTGSGSEYQNEIRTQRETETQTECVTAVESQCGNPPESVSYVASQNPCTDHEKSQENAESEPVDMPAETLNLHGTGMESLMVPNPNSKSWDSKVRRDLSRCCTIALVKETFYKRLMTAYHMHHWVDRSGKNLSSQCMIQPIYVVTVSKEPRLDSLHIHPDYITNPDDPCNNPECVYMPAAELLDYKELCPPSAMKQGNIGTPTAVFREAISQCRLPANVIHNLGIKFHKKAGDKEYSSLPHDYTNQIQAEDLPPSYMVGAAITLSGHRILTHEEYIHDRQLQKAMAEARDHRSIYHTNTKYTTRNRADSESDGETEETDRHAMHNDDVMNVERNKERLFEEEIELKWEKGGSGLVFYTDAQYWKQFEGDFDEQTTNDWDVDMSEYHEPGTGDKDARDEMTMRQEKRLRGGQAIREETSAFAAWPRTKSDLKKQRKKERQFPGEREFLLGHGSNVRNIGNFERHTKGVGRRLLESQGWTEGQGVGKSVQGRAQIVDTGGQHPRDRTGFGYYGEKIDRTVTKKKKRDADAPIISTIYDDPGYTDEPETLLERKNPHNIKHRSANSVMASATSSQSSTSRAPVTGSLSHAFKAPVVDGQCRVVSAPVIVKQSVMNLASSSTCDIKPKMREND